MNVIDVIDRLNPRRNLPQTMCDAIAQSYDETKRMLLKELRRRFYEMAFEEKGVNHDGHTWVTYKDIECVLDEIEGGKLKVEGGRKRNAQGTKVPCCYFFLGDEK